MPILPHPHRGLVIVYDYLWRDEAVDGKDEGTRSRPCVIVLAVRRRPGVIMVTVAPITHAPPRNPRSTLELPAATKRRLGLDDQRSWIVLLDLNQFSRPGTDLRALAGSDDAFAYGALASKSLQRTERSDCGAV